MLPRKARGPYLPNGGSRSIEGDPDGLLPIIILTIHHHPSPSSTKTPHPISRVKNMKPLLHHPPGTVLETAAAAADECLAFLVRCKPSNREAKEGAQTGSVGPNLLHSSCKRGFYLANSTEICGKKDLCNKHHSKEFGPFGLCSMP